VSICFTAVHPLPKYSSSSTSILPPKLKPENIGGKKWRPDLNENFVVSPHSINTRWDAVLLGEERRGECPLRPFFFVDLVAVWLAAKRDPKGNLLDTPLMVFF
jgi:hypothetical protein